MLQRAIVDQTVWTQDGSVKSQIRYRSIFQSLCLMYTDLLTAVCIPRTALVDFIPYDDICADHFHVEIVWSRQMVKTEADKY